MAVPLANRVKGVARNGLRPHTTFQDALGARMSHQQQRQGGRQIRIPRNLNQTNRYTLSQSNTFDPNPNTPLYNTLSKTNPYNHISKSQSRPTYNTNTNHNINNNNGYGFIPHHIPRQYGQTNHGYHQNHNNQSNGRYNYNSNGFPYGQQLPEQQQQQPNKNTNN